MIFIQPLHNRQGLFGRVTKYAIGIPLQLRKIISNGRQFPFCLPFKIDYLGPFTGNGSHYGIGPGFIKNTGLSVILIPPFYNKPRNLGMDNPVILRHKLFYFLLPLYDHGQGGGLYPACRQLGIIFTGQRPGNV